MRIDRSLRRSLLAFSADRLRWLDEAAALGPIARLRFGIATVWVVSDPEAARTMLVTDSDAWTRPPAMRTPIRLGVGENLFTQSDRAWARLQPEVAPAFRKRALEARLGVLDEIVEPEVAALPLNTDVDLALAMGRVALIAAAWVLLGERLDRERAESLAEHQRHVVAWVPRRLGQLSSGTPFSFSASTRRMREHRDALGRYADDVVARARARSQAGDEPAADVLGALLAVRPGGKPLDVGALRSHVLGLFFAGNETTAAALSWALVNGARNPAEWARLRADPDRARGFVDETLRINPAVWGFTRTPTRGGVNLRVGEQSLRMRRGEVVTVYVRGANRNPAVWPDPARFDPDRHLALDRDHSRALIPFGLGPRGCIGQHLAMAEMLAVLPILARHGDVSIDGEVTEDASFALRAAGGLRGRFTVPTP